MATPAPIATRSRFCLWFRCSLIRSMSLSKADKGECLRSSGMPLCPEAFIRSPLVASAHRGLPQAAHGFPWKGRRTPGRW